MCIPGQIDFFSARGINSIDDYERFYHTRAYIRQKAKAGDPRFKQDSRLLPFFKEIAEKTGYKNFSKFLMRKTAWDNLEDPIPLSYLCAIGAEREVLALTQEADNDEFEQALALPRYPKYAVVRIMAAIYSTRTFPAGTPEDEAVELLKGFMEEQPFRCCINYPALLSVYVEPDGRVGQILYPPRLDFTKTHAVPVKDGSLIGISRIG